jgi:type IV pilus assembly protein PilM
MNWQNKLKDKLQIKPSAKFDFKLELPSFGKKPTAVLGIDITTTVVKLLELSKQGNHYKVESYMVAPLPRDAVIDKHITNVEVIGEAIKKAVQRSGTSLKQAAVAVGGSSVITKLITLPAGLTDDEMVEQIMVEADQYIPYGIDEVNFDFELQGVNEVDSRRVNVLLAASRKENVEDRVATLTIAGLKAKIVDIEAFAIENSFVLLANQLPYSVENKTVVVIEIGANLTTLHVLYNSRTIYVREQNFGGKQLTEDIQRAYGLNYDEAGVSKKLGGLPDNYESDVLEPFKRNMVQQIQRAIQFFVASNANRPIDSVIVAGGCASIAGVDHLVSQALGVPTYIANPFVNMKMSSRVDPKNLGKDAPSMLIACGLALRSFDQ